MEDGPVGELCLGKHLALDLTIDFSCALLDVKAVRSSTSIWTHEKFTSSVLETLELLGILVKFQVPQFLLLFALLVVLEVVHKILNLLDLSVCISVDDLGQVLH